jgi:beta-glucanase (GH16 family)
MIPYKTISLFCIMIGAGSSAISQNLLSNGNFESGNISPWQGFKNQVLTDDITNSSVGNIDNGDGSLYQVFNVTPNQTYHVAFDYRWVNAGLSNMTVRIKDGTSGGNNIASFTLNQTVNQWFTNASFNFTVPDGISIVRIVFYKAPGNQPLRIDNVYISDPNAPISNFVDPDTPVNVQPFGSVSGEWVLDFSDEFNGTVIDTNKWMVSVSTQSRAPRPNLGIDDWWWVQNNAFLDGNGQLTLRATKEDFNTMYCGSIETRDIYETTYGYMEARIKIATTAKGNHTAFWLQGENMGNVNNSGQDGAEIDIFESAWVTDDTKAVIHFDGYGADKKNHTIPYDTPGIHNGYHIFGMLWTENEIRIFYDGVEVMSTNPNKPFPFTTDPNGYPLVPQVPEWLWLSVGASFADGDFISQPVGLLSDAKVDWVRVFKNNQTLSNNIAQHIEIEIYPNPTTNGEVYIVTKDYIEQVSLFDQQGKLIKTFSHSDKLNYLSVPELQSGVYFLKINFNKTYAVKKLIIQ